MMIRISAPSDAEAISEVLRAAFTPFKGGCTPGAFKAITPAAEEIRGRYSEGPIWVASVEAKIVGTVSAVPGTEWLYIRSMAVRPEVQGNGVGYRLLDSVERYAVEHGSDHLFLYTSDFLSGALQFYRRCGFIRGKATTPEEWFGTGGWEMHKKLVGNTKQNATGS